MERVAGAGAAAALARFRSSAGAENKAEGGMYDPVTEGDRAAEQAMRALIGAEFPGHGVLGEEFPETVGDGDWRWVLDPIDGTRGFMSGTPTWTTLVGLEWRGDPRYGAIAQPFTGEMWVGGPSGTQYRNQDGSRPASVSSVSSLREARAATTDPRPVPVGYMSEEESAAVGTLTGLCPVTRFGLDAYAYALLALGHLDLVVEAGLKRYDVSALVPVVRGAGGFITAWDGGPPETSGRIVAAATYALHAAALDALSAWA